MATPLLPAILLVAAILLTGNSAGGDAEASRPLEAAQREPAGEAISEQRADPLRTRRAVQDLNRQVTLLHEEEKYRDALPLAEKAHELAVRDLVEYHPVAISAANNLGALYVFFGRYADGLPLLRGALDEMQRLRGDNHPRLLPAVSNLASLYRSQGRLGEAEEMYLWVLRISEEGLGEEHLHTLKALSNLAGLYRAQGRLDEAEPLYERARETSERVLGKDHAISLGIANNLASLYQSQGRYDEAERLFEKTLRLTAEKFGDDHPDTLGSRNNLALLYADRGRRGEAEEMLKEVLPLSEVVMGPDHPSVLKTMNSLAILYRRMSRFGEAEKLHREALRRSERTLGETHPHTMRQVSHLVRLYFAMEKPGEIATLLQRLEQAAALYTDAELPHTSGEAQKRRLLRRQSLLPNLALNLAIRYPTESRLRFAATAVMRWRQVQGEELSFLQQLSRRSSDETVRLLATDLRVARRDLSRLANQRLPDSGELQAALRKLAGLEVELSRRSRRFREHLAVRELDLDQVRHALPGTAALLVLATYQPLSGPTEIDARPLHYAAVMLTGDGTADLRVMDVGPVEQIRKAGSALKDGQAGASSWMYQRLFGAWEDAIEGLESVYVVPDGWLHLMNFERLTLPNGRYWIERQPVHRLQTARDLVRRFPAPTNARGLLALGGIDYGPPLAPDGDEAPPAAAHRNLAGQLEKGFEPLTASGREAEQVAVFFWTAGDTGIEPEKAVLGEEEASEHALKQLTQPPWLLHFATHGFYLEDRLELGRPMVLSGLALANANRGAKGETDAHGEDGILYALEAQDLQLEGTQLVTLSACNTGQGVVDYAEGIYGLVRAFRIAGARHVLMALAEVNDLSTFRFMKRFYLRWFASGGAEHPYAALRATKLSYIRSRFDAERSPDTWARFVLIEVP